jgi:hypothetical protein
MLSRDKVLVLIGACRVTLLLKLDSVSAAPLIPTLAEGCIRSYAKLPQMCSVPVPSTRKGMAENVLLPRRLHRSVKSARTYQVHVQYGVQYIQYLQNPFVWPSGSIFGMPHHYHIVVRVLTTKLKFNQSNSADFNILMFSAEPSELLSYTHFGVLRDGQTKGYREESTSTCHHEVVPFFPDQIFPPFLISDR